MEMVSSPAKTVKACNESHSSSHQCMWSSHSSSMSLLSALAELPAVTNSIVESMNVMGADRLTQKVETKSTTRRIRSIDSVNTQIQRKRGVLSYQVSRFHGLGRKTA